MEAVGEEAWMDWAEGELLLNGYKTSVCSDVKKLWKWLNNTTYVKRLQNRGKNVLNVFQEHSKKKKYFTWVVMYLKRNKHCEL